ncbi:MAG TPA: hypothetical protein VN700_03190 [Vicinamibacterales bacterium]|nr:hypothetical protein [Vicinamibacterales bacterium]
MRRKVIGKVPKVIDGNRASQAVPDDNDVSIVRQRLKRTLEREMQTPPVVLV